MCPEKNYLTIGELVKKLKSLYPDISSSKLRFLESKGLINPDRASNKYRIYSREDVEKINFILKMQKEYFMPLEVIKEKLSTVDFKKIDEKNNALQDIQLKLGEEFKDFKPKSLTLEEVVEKFKLPSSYINELIEYNIVEVKEEGEQKIISGEDIELIKIIKELENYGIHARHLKLFDNFASRHASFIQQIVLPLLLSANKGSHKKAKKVLESLESFLKDFHSILVKKKNKKFLKKHK